MLIRTGSFVLKMESLFDEEKDNYPDFYTVTITTETIDDLTPYWMSDGDKNGLLSATSPSVIYSSTVRVGLIWYRRH